MRRTATGLHANQTGRAICTMRQKTRSLNRFVHNLACLSFDPMSLEYALDYIHADYCLDILHLGPSCLPVENFVLPRLGHFDAVAL